MKEQFDRKLAEKIKASFLDHEEPFNPQEWEKLSLSYFRHPKKKKFIFWPFLVSGIAASLLLLLMFWPISEDIKENVQTIADSITINSKQFEKIETPEVQDRELALQKEGFEPLGNLEAPAGDISTNLPADESQRTEAIKHIPEADRPALSSMEDLRSIKEEIKANAANEKIGNTVIVENNDVQKAQQWVDQWKSEDAQPSTLAEVIAKGRSGEGNNMRLGVLVGPQASSSAVSGMSLGAGVMSEFSLNDRLKIDVGVTYSRHSMVPEGQMPARQSSDAASLESAAGLMNNLYTNPRVISSGAELNFSGLDIPINLKYKVMDKEQSGLFLITGLSTMVYLDQQATETMTLNTFFTNNKNGTLDFSESVETYTLETGPDDRSDGVDLGKMLNLSIGYEYSLKNGTYLSIEPYYKLPLGNMTFANQQFSIGGLNLRMNFNIGK